VSLVSARERLVTMPNDEKPGSSATEDAHASAGGHGLTYLCVGASAGEMYRPNPKFA
jgi:hypothetical protein